MKNLQIFESFAKRSIVLESRQKRKITFDVEGGKIQNIVNESGVRFPTMLVNIIIEILKIGAVTMDLL